MSPRRQFSIVALVFGLLFSTAASHAGLAVLKDSVSVDNAAGTATFNLDFGHAPDFYTLTPTGQPVDAFTIEIAGNPKATNPTVFNNLTGIVHGDEIHLINALPIRNPFPPVTDPAAGGWGSLRGTTAFSVTGDTLTFTAPLKTLGAPGGKFGFLAIASHNGSEVASSQGASVPLPPALTIGMIMLGACILVSTCKTRMQARHMA